MHPHRQLQSARGGATADRPTGRRTFDEAGDATRRTRLANERTYLAWWRTGLTSLAVGLGAGKLVPGHHEQRPTAGATRSSAPASRCSAWPASATRSAARRPSSRRSRAGEFAPPDARITLALTIVGLLLGLAHGAADRLRELERHHVDCGVSRMSREHCPYGTMWRMPPPTVLIVDDHPSFRYLARTLLESEGFEVDRRGPGRRLRGRGGRRAPAPGRAARRPAARHRRLRRRPPADHRERAPSRPSCSPPAGTRRTSGR